ncbi:MAG: BMP family ABC transporter substrate-binding protein [Planctomycetes bacterium]|nr:BMP family ABC transporter substrate-binding protein [Planctomycetota bacterium]
MHKSLAATLVLSSLVLAGCGGCEGDEDTPKPYAGIVFDVGGIDDKSFNESAYRGLKRAQKDLGIEVERYEPSQSADRQTGLRRLCAQGCAVVVGVGYLFTDDLLAIARDFPEIQFACIDMNPVPPETIPANLVGISFREEQGSFLVGAIAGLLTKTKTVGFVGGMNIPLIHKFEAGYRAGVEHVAPGVEVIANYAGEQDTAFLDPEKGKALALGQYGSGADIIYHASGKTGLGVIQAAKETGKLAIGVDSDQYHEAPGHILTSMVKRVDVAVFETIKAAKEGRFQGGTRVLGLEDEGVGFVYDEHNKDLIPEEVYRRVMALREEIVAGKIVVPTTP